MCNGINLGLRDAWEVLCIPFNQGHEFFAEFRHGPILRSRARAVYLIYLMAPEKMRVYIL